MKAYAKPAASRVTNLGASSAGRIEHIAMGVAARLGAIAGGLICLSAGIVTIVFSLFGVNFWYSLFEMRWVFAAQWDSLAAFMAAFGGLVAVTVAATMLGGLLGALTAWIYNLTTPAPVEEIED